MWMQEAAETAQLEVRKGWFTKTPHKYLPLCIGRGAAGIHHLPAPWPGRLRPPAVTGHGISGPCPCRGWIHTQGGDIQPFGFLVIPAASTGRWARGSVWPQSLSVNLLESMEG